MRFQVIRGVLVTSLELAARSDYQPSNTTLLEFKDISSVKHLAKFTLRTPTFTHNLLSSSRCGPSNDAGYNNPIASTNSRSTADAEDQPGSLTALFPVSSLPPEVASVATDFFAANEQKILSIVLSIRHPIITSC